MLLSELFEQVNTAYRGSDDDAPTDGTPDYTLWLNTTNRKISEWARDGKATRQSLFEVRTLGTVSAGTQSYDLDDDLLLLADNVTVTLGDVVTSFDIVKPQERTGTLQSVYISGRDPQVLTFVDTIDSTKPYVGGTISLAGYFLPEDLDDASDVIPVDDPYWLVYAVASELAFNDLTYESKAGDLNAKANALYAMMMSNNRRGTGDNPRTARTSVTRIAGSAQ